MVARSVEKVKMVEEEIRRKTAGKVQVKAIIVDLCKSAMDLEVYKKIAKEVEGLDLAIVVNNAGVAFNKELRL